MGAIRKYAWELPVLENQPSATNGVVVGKQGYTSLRPDKIREALDVLADAQPIVAAAIHAGVSERTFHRWLERGRKDGADPVYQELAANVQYALALAETNHLKNINDASFGRGPFDGKPQWTASAWWLERHKPDKYGRKTTTKHEGHDGKAVSFTLNIGRTDQIDQGEGVEAIPEAEYERIE